MQTESMPLIKIRNKLCPNTQPCDTPFTTGQKDDKHPWTTANPVLSCKKQLIYVSNSMSYDIARSANTWVEVSVIDQNNVVRNLNVPVVLPRRYGATDAANDCIEYIKS